jgi:hypothetical protein
MATLKQTTQTICRTTLVCSRCQWPREQVMAGDLLERCLGCFADDMQRYGAGQSQRVSTLHWWHQPAVDWLREHPDVCPPPSRVRKYRRDVLGWHSNKHQFAQPAKVYTTTSVEAGVAAAMAATQIAARLAAKLEVA